MTKAEAIEILRANYPDACYEQLREAVNMAIEALETDVPDTNVGDTISRQRLQDAMYHEAFETDSDMQKWDGGCWIRYKMFENVVEALPSAQSGRYKWNPIKDGLPDEEGVYFVTDDAGGMATVYLDVFSHYEDGSPYWLYSQNVTAWMYTPEPWKGEER